MSDKTVLAALITGGFAIGVALIGAIALVITDDGPTTINVGGTEQATTTQDADGTTQTINAASGATTEARDGGSSRGSPVPQPTFIGIPLLTKIGLPEGGEITNIKGCISGRNYTVARYEAFLEKPATISSIKIQAWNAVPSKIRVGASDTKLQEYDLVQDGSTNSSGFSFYKADKLASFNAIDSKLIIEVVGSSAFGVCIIEVN